MPLEKAKSGRARKGQPVSFRLTDEAHNGLVALSKALNQSQVKIIEQLILDAVKDVKKRYPKDFRAAKRKT